MANTEGRIQLALQAYRQGQFSSLRAAAKPYGASRTTLTRRSHGTPSRSDFTSPNRKLTPTEESVLVEWILSMDSRGMPPTKALVQQMAEILLAERVQDASSIKAQVGQQWVYRFITRHPELKSRYNRKYDYQRAKCEDPEIIQAWFRLVRNTIAKYGILDADIYNFDETGFQMGIISTSKVVTAADRARTVSIQPGNREWVTVIESINATGWALPPMVIFKGKMRQYSWYETVPTDWTIGVSDNGWTTDALGLTWLKDTFDKHTRNRTVGKYRLLILDGHGSHITAEFDQYCSQNSIIVLCMPPHSSHLLQPLDVSCFSVLKRSYGKAVEGYIRMGINHVDKDDFTVLYQQARTASFSSTTILNGFKATGIVPLDPDQVLLRLDVRLRTPSPSLPTQAPSPWVPETPHNTAELQLHSAAIQGLIRYCTQSPPSPTVKAVKQLIKGCQMAMHSAAILAAENTSLRAANERVKRKRQKRRSYVGKGGASTAVEVQEGQNQAIIDVEEGVQVVQQPEIRVQNRAPRMCSICRSLEHTARTCLER
jgi:hypothetical protein